MSTVNPRKHFGIVYTPAPIVSSMVDRIPSLSDTAICDPACGDGQFLVAVAEQLCARLQRSRSPAAKARLHATLRQLTGYDLDPLALRRCRQRLSAALARHGYPPVRWRLRQLDALDRSAWARQAGRFDCVIGNPPYVRIQHLEAPRRARINASHWRLLSGCTDLFILFFEMGLDLLRQDGRLIYITPNSWLRSQAGAPLRRHLRDANRLVSITDYGQHQVFADATTYTAITEVQKGGSTKGLPSGSKCIGLAAGQRQFTAGTVSVQAGAWNVLSERDTGFIHRLERRPRRLADVADIHVGIQTLADSVFILPEGALDLEPGITRRIFKASAMRDGRDTENRIAIYPYEGGKLIAEDQLRAQYPKAYAYLSRHKPRLLARDKGRSDPRKWHGYGREVSITSCFGEKLLTSSMNPRPNFQLCPDPDALFYSGYCVKPKPGVSTARLLDELNSETMERYIRLTARPYQGGWYSYAKSTIQNFPLPARIVA